MRIIKFMLVIIVVGIMWSCDQTTQKPYKIGYVNLNHVYQTNNAIVKADSTHELQLQQIIDYTATVQSNIYIQKLDGKKLETYTNACNDTILAYKQKVDNIYNSVVVFQNNRIQIAIDSVAVTRNYNYVLSTVNNNILYVQNNDDELTGDVIELLKGK